MLAKPKENAVGNVSAKSGEGHRADLIPGRAHIMVCGTLAGLELRDKGDEVRVEELPTTGPDLEYCKHIEKEPAKIGNREIHNTALQFQYENRMEEWTFHESTDTNNNWLS
ncbi:unnamed protein product, partial [Iphiclides podalirius]